MACKQIFGLFHNRTFIYSSVIGVSPYYTMFCELNCIRNSHIYKLRIRTCFVKRKYECELGVFNTLETSANYAEVRNGA